jgi:hypothetical protein
MTMPMRWQTDELEFEQIWGGVQKHRRTYASAEIMPSGKLCITISQRGPRGGPCGGYVRFELDRVAEDTKAA